MKIICFRFAQCMRKWGGKKERTFFMSIILTPSLIFSVQKATEVIKIFPVLLDSYLCNTVAFSFGHFREQQK